jgi:transcriptional regulator with XRE-family HTH domain
LTGYTPDTVNSVVMAYAEPVFHCDVSYVAAPDGRQYPVVTVPGGHHVPIKARRDGPNGQTVRSNSYYIRRPGPQSENPQNGAEWDALIRRCIANAREQLLDQMRTIFAGGHALEPPEDERTAAMRWFDESLARWAELTANVAAQSPVRFPLGHFAIGYCLVGNLNRLTQAQLLEAIDRSTVRHTGWPEFWVPTRDELRPYIYNNEVECWIARDGEDHGPAHNDYWRASPDGSLFLIRGLQEDEVRDGVTPGTLFDITMPAWRVGEALLHAANMAREFGDPAARVILIAEWTGLAGRVVTSLEGRRLVFDDRRAQQDTFRTSLTAQADQISDTLPELVSQLLVPLYERFDFFRLPAALPREELAQMRANRF